MIKKLQDGYYVDSWYDRHTRSYVTQLKDTNGYEIDCQYSGNKNDRDFDINYYATHLNEFLTEDMKLKKKEKELPYFDTLHPIPDAGAGIETFNHNMGNDSGEGMCVGEALDQALHSVDDEILDDLEYVEESLFEESYTRIGLCSLYEANNNQLTPQDKQALQDYMKKESDPDKINIFLQGLLHKDDNKGSV